MILSGLLRGRIRKLTFLNAVGLLLSVVLLIGIGGCSESPPVTSVEKPLPSEEMKLSNDLAGKWRGATDDDIVVELEVTKAEGEPHKASVHYDPPHACSIEANEVRKRDDDTVLFQFEKQTATGRGFCFKLGDKKMTLKREGEGLRMNVEGDHNTIEQTVLLTRP